MYSFATVQDYEDRYGGVEDTAQLGVLLSDASAYIAAQPGFEYAGSTDPRYEAQWANLTRVTCSVVHRALSAGDLAGERCKQDDGNIGIVVLDFFGLFVDLTVFGIGNGDDEVEPFCR